MWIQILLSIFGIIIIVVAVIVKIKLSGSIKKIDVLPNMPIIENDYRSEFTDGYTWGILKSIYKCKNGCSRIEFYPIDVQQGEYIPRPGVKSYVVKNEFIKPFSLGELSSYRNRIKTITRDKSLIPEKIKDETEGKWTEALLENFNKEAKLRKCKYKMVLEFGYPHLVRDTFFIFRNLSIQILYNNIQDYFYFWDGIDEEIFKEIEEVLKVIPERFKIEIEEEEE